MLLFCNLLLKLSVYYEHLFRPIDLSPHYFFLNSFVVLLKMLCINTRNREKYDVNIPPEPTLCTFSLVFLNLSH